MLLTLNASCLRTMLKPAAGGEPKLRMLRLPQYAREVLELHGLNLTTDLLAGSDRRELDALREHADKAGCACLMLAEREPQVLASDDMEAADAAVARLARVVEAGSILGCAAIAVSIRDDAGPDAAENAVDRLREVVELAEAKDMSVLVAPCPGLTAKAEHLTDLIKQVGGFRVGTCPDFEAAAGQADASAYLRRLTPYASVVIGSTREVTGPGDGAAADPAALAHASYDLGTMIRAIVSVGYSGNLAVDYRGGGDVTLGVRRSRQLLSRLLEQARSA